MHHGRQSCSQGVGNTGRMASQPHPALLPTGGKGISVWANFRALVTVKLRPGEERLPGSLFTLLASEHPPWGPREALSGDHQLWLAQV